MSSSAEEALSQLNKWKSGSTRLFLNFTGAGLTAWCVGVLQRVSEAELSLGVEGIDEKDLLFSINVHSARFRRVDVKEETPFFSPQRGQFVFGEVIEITLKSKAKVCLCELCDQTIDLG